MKTVCVGRFLIDIPEGSAIQFSAARISGVEISPWPDYSEAKLKGDVDARVEEIGEKKNEYDLPSLEKRLVADAVNFNASVLYYDRQKPLTMVSGGTKVIGTDDAISVEAFGLHGSTAYHFKGEHFTVPRFENNVLDIVKRFEAQQDNEIPSAAGFCVERGLVHEPIAPSDNESITLFAAVKGHPDIAIRLDTMVNTERLQEPLLARDAKNRVKLEHPSNFKSLQKRARSVNGIEGEELLDKVREQNGTNAHMFTWASMGKLNDVLAPKITLELQTGKGRPGEPVDASLSDSAVLELWERVSSSVRLRPSAPAKKAAALDPNPKAALGDLVTTGQICPQSGLWECSETGAVQDGRQQYIAAGQPMPYAVLIGAPSLMERLRREQPLHRTATVWKLVSHESTGGNADAGPEEKLSSAAPATPDGVPGDDGTGTRPA